MTLTAETTTGAFLSADVCSESKIEREEGGAASSKSAEPTVPEELAELGAKRLLEEVYR
jgi:hypothetical protein